MSANTPGPRRRWSLLVVLALLVGFGLLAGVAFASAPGGAAAAAVADRPLRAGPLTDYNSTDVPKTIPDSGTVTSTLLIADAAVVTNLNVINVVISHTLAADLRVVLISPPPASTRITLFDGVCGGDDWNASNTGFRLSDGAVRAMGDTCPPGTGTYRPAQALSTLNGQLITGLWTLEITDQAAEDSGVLLAWGLANPGAGPEPTLTAMPTTTLVAQPTFTPCALPFVDVAPTDYFYPGVQFLFCKGAISGYADNTYRPGNPTTRGQMTKIVVLGLDVPRFPPPANPTFSDVPPSNPFYSYIENAVQFGIVSGYADGTFRPGNEVTRGQLVKMVVRATWWDLIAPPVQTFSDVPPSAPFYAEIATAACHNVVSGYSDGTFRPGNSATRGQIAKITYLSYVNVAACSLAPTPLPRR